MSSRARFIVAIASVLCIASPAVADQPGSGDEETTRDPLRAQRLYDLGATLFSSGEFAEAAKMFGESYEHDPRPGALFNQGRCLEEDGQKAAAAAAYRAYIEAAPDGDATDEARTRVLALERQLELEAGTENRTERVETRKGRLLRLTGLGVAAAGVALLAGGAAFGLQARSIASDLEDRPRGAWTDEEIQRFEDGETADRRALIFASVGVVAIATGTVLYVLGHRSRYELRVAPALSSDGAGASVSLRF